MATQRFSSTIKPGSFIRTDFSSVADAETRLDGLHPRFAERVFTPAEREALEAAPDRHRLHWALWAAKESAYKALPALAQHLVRWRDIVISPGASGFTARVQGTSLGVQYPEIEGQWRLGAGVLTWATCGWP